MKKICCCRTLLTCLATLMTCFGTAVGQTLTNGSISLKFDSTDGRLVSMMDEKTGNEFIDAEAVCGPLWKIFTPEGEMQCSEFEYSGTRSEAPGAMSLEWKSGNGIKVTVSVRLDEEKPLCYWKVFLEGISGKDVLAVRCPVIQGIERMENEDLAVSTWLGSVIHDPHSPLGEGMKERSFAWDSPGILSMQMLSLYDRENGSGLYLASNDTLSQSKRFELRMDTEHTEYSLENFLPFRSGEDSYSTGYEAVTGSLRGDWLTAAKIYREWAQDQRWCRESRFHGGQIPRWVTKTGLWVWNRGFSDNVLTEARHMKHRLGIPVSVLWHWWHGCSYDEGFPEYLPPREGGGHFIKAVKKARKDNVNAIVYMNSFQWGNSTESYVNEHAEDHAAKQFDGSLYTSTANIFTGRQITPMCLGDEYWREKYSSIADTAICKYGVSGIYMDQACSSIKCYDKSHGHTLGGGNYWTEGFARQASRIREKVGDRRKGIVLAGEGSGEDWIPSLDLFLTLEASRERYLGTGETEVLPLYQAVYHDYAITFGSYSSLVYPPYDDLWPDEFRPANRETPLPDSFDSQFRMEQARSFVYGMQPTLANYHAFLDTAKKEEIDFLLGLAKVRKKALKYLLEGTFERVPVMEIPKDTILVSKVSIYAGRSGNTVKEEKMTVPMVYAGMWKAKDGSMGLALVNISDCPQPVRFTIDSEDYGLQQSFKATLVTEKGQRKLGSTWSGIMDIDFPLSGRSACLVRMEP